ncbi:S-layer homology domain-containing protein [Domibacillus indicus]|uniref:S-layer homology domain-containing protein n=1 Tax=Domibacillus indicus TaxID=1437523 RepID=UPI0009E486E7|nr:S-layer homology domain-containing protein [Domibacillus indicus]
MKKIVQAAGLFFLISGFAASGQASAASSACSAYGSVQPGVNPSYQHLNCLVTAEALEKNIPPEVAKAVMTQESQTWKQFDASGNAIISPDGGIGLMQLTNQPQFDEERLKTDLLYNIESGITVLDQMYSRSVPKIAGAGRDVIENWYFPVMAYNGIKPVNSPVQKETGLRNRAAYQEQVFAKLEQFSYVNDTELAEFPFQSSDFQYDPASSENIVFTRMSYSLTDQTHRTVYQWKAGDRAVTTGSPNLRKTPGGEKMVVIPENTVLTITGPFQFNENNAAIEQFVWYPVKSASGQAGFVSSAYLEKTDKPAVQFTDVPPRYGFYQDIMALTSQGIINGYKDGSFRPDAQVTRGQAAAMMVRALALPLNGMSEIKAAQHYGVMSGYTNGEFYQERPVTRGQMAIIMTNAFKLTESAPISFRDVGRSMSAYESIQRVTAAGIAYGYSDNTFRPDQPVKRGEFSAFLNRALQ